mgnify:CR=1 FL=1
MKVDTFYVPGFWRFQWVVLITSIVLMSGAMITIEASLLPIHWNIYGDADRFADKNLALALWPVIIFALILFMKAIARLEKRKDNLKQSKKATSVVLGSVSLLLLIIQLFAILLVLGLIQSFAHWVVCLISIVFLVMGNFLTKIHSNYSMGIRTKWTLGDERVWVKTHRFTSLLIILIAVLSLTSIFWMPPQWLFINVVVFILGLLISVPYSYLVHKKLNS